jgi:hypothetical protein
MDINHLCGYKTNAEGEANIEKSSVVRLLSNSPLISKDLLSQHFFLEISWSFSDKLQLITFFFSFIQHCCTGANNPTSFILPKQ